MDKHFCQRDVFIPRCILIHTNNYCKLIHLVYVFILYIQFVWKQCINKLNQIISNYAYTHVIIILNSHELLSPVEEVIILPLTKLACRYVITVVIISFISKKSHII